MHLGKYYPPHMGGMETHLQTLCEELGNPMDLLRLRWAQGRIFEPAEVARRDPEGVIASWCGRKVKREKIVSRPGWERVRAVVDDQLYEVKSALILQPGPAALTDGLDAIRAAIRAWR